MMRSRTPLKVQKSLTTVPTGKAWRVYRVWADGSRSVLAAFYDHPAALAYAFRVNALWESGRLLTQNAV